MFEPDTDEFGHPIAWGGETKEPSLFNDSNVRQSVNSLDSGFENTRGEGIGNLGRNTGVGRNYDEINAVARQGPAPSLPGPPAPETKLADDLSQDVTSSIGKEGGGGIGNLVEKTGADIAGEVAGGAEEGIGAGLLASGIFAPLGAILEGLGAVTEVASVGAGAYGAVQSFAEQGVEETLRNKFFSETGDRFTKRQHMATLAQPTGQLDNGEVQCAWFKLLYTFIDDKGNIDLTNRSMTSEVFDIVNDTEMYTYLSDISEKWNLLANNLEENKENILTLRKYFFEFFESISDVSKVSTSPVVKYNQYAKERAREGEAKGC